MVSLGLASSVPLTIFSSKVVVREDRGLAVDVAHVPADYAHVSSRGFQVQSGGDAGWWRDPFDTEVLSCGVVALAFDVGFPGVRGRRDSAVWPLELG